MPVEIDALGSVVARRGIRLGPHIVLSLSNPMWWFRAPLKYAYLNWLPEEWQQGYRNFQRRLLPLATGPHSDDSRQLTPHLAPPTTPEIEFVLERCAAYEPDVIIVNHAWLGEMFRQFPENNRALRVVLAPDIMHQRKADFEARGLPAGLGDWDEAMAVVKRAVEAVAARAPRVSLVLKADIRPGVTGALTAKVAAVERYLQA